MMNDSVDKLIKQLKKHEGIELKPYKCTSNKLTIGIGRNLEDVGISEHEAEFLLMNDLDTYMTAAKSYNWYAGLNDARKAVIVNMLFNMGQTNFNKFLKMKQALDVGDHAEAGKQMLDSKWAKQVKGRSEELSKQMETGKWQQ
jgi:lysozyme